jgi:hypothetical protein
MPDKTKALAIKNRFIAKQRDQGLCLECMNKAKSGRVRCGDCLDRRQQLRREHQKDAARDGRCIYCLKIPALAKHRLCEKCYFRDVSWKHFRTTRLWSDLRQKWNEQRGECALSGVAITIGVDAELDHIVPTSRGGSKDIGNTQWVLSIVNRMKDNLTEDEFFGLVEKLYHSLKKKR